MNSLHTTTAKFVLVGLFVSSLFSCSHLVDRGPMVTEQKDHYSLEESNPQVLEGLQRMLGKTENLEGLRVAPIVTSLN